MFGFVRFVSKSFIYKSTPASRYVASIVQKCSHAFSLSRRRAWASERVVWALKFLNLRVCCAPSHISTQASEAPPGRCIKFVETLSCNACDLTDLLQNLSKFLQHLTLCCSNQSWNGIFMVSIYAPECRASIAALTAFIPSALERYKFWDFGKRS